MSTARFHTIDTLRGIASLAVAWYHFMPPDPALAARYGGTYGYLGVAMFFVISGFIIPHTLSLAKYELRQYGTFLLKRIIRLDPAYLVTVAGILALGFLDPYMPGFHGPSAFHPTVAQVLLHIGYLNALFDYPWLNIVFWTLAVEFQFYLIIGLIFPLLVSPKPWLRVALLLLLSLSAFAIPTNKLFFHYSFLFTIGFMTFYYRDRHIGWPAYASGLAIFGAGAWYTLGTPIAVAGLVTAAAIAFINIQTAKMTFAGRISYSLYLCHLPIGSRILRASEKLIPGSSQNLIGMLLALGGSLFAAWLLHRFVERPSQVWSSSIGYPHRQVAPTGFGPRVG